MPRGFQQIGDLAKAAMPSQPPSESTERHQRTSPLSSTTTGSPSRAVTASRPTGTPPGATGSASTSISTVPDLGRAMAGDNPLQTDQAVVALLPPRVRSLLTPRYVYPKNEPDGYRLMSYTVAGNLTVEEIETALAAIDAASRAASKNEIVIFLARLKAMTVSPAQSQEEITGQMAFYAEELLHYPGDIVRHVLKTQPDQGKFWPAWQEIAARIDRAYDARRLMRAALQRAQGSTLRLR